ncbi:MAG TPA: hypothetical protein P5102_05120 [Candidatus Competibacteraceae bacterium]|nr:hypothetical protein [Candidatus Competibacteraceae bacterium]
MTPDRLDDWHRLFGLTLTDVFSDTPWRVELEKDLTMQRQLLDVVIIEQTAPASAAANLPDGLDQLRAHNLLTYKSKQEPLDGWALHELIGHYVNYRKLISPKPGLLPESDFQLYAVATRYPQGLARGCPLQPTAWPGVYDVPWGAARIRLIVLNAIAQHPRNAAWELFSTQQDRIRHGAAHYRPRRPRRPGTWDLLYRLYLMHLLEDPNMADTMEEYVREIRQQFLHSLTPEERQAVLDQLPPEEVFKHFTPEERLRGLGPEELRQLQDYLKTLH